jgi:hypothetical protein
MLASIFLQFINTKKTITTNKFHYSVSLLCFLSNLSVVLSHYIVTLILIFIQYKKTCILIPIPYTAMWQTSDWARNGLQ